MSIPRRALLAGSLALGSVLSLRVPLTRGQGQKPTITVYKSPS